MYPNWKLLCCSLLLILKPFLALCLLDYSIVLNKTPRLESSNWIQIWSASNTWVSSSALNFWPAFLHKFLICLSNINLRSTVISGIISSSLFLNWIYSSLECHYHYCFYPYTYTCTYQDLRSCDCQKKTFNYCPEVWKQ